MPRVTQAFRDKQRARIYGAAARCFANAGFHATSMDDIIDETGMSSGTVYRYFPGGKQEIIREVCALRLGRVVDQLDQLASEPVTPGVTEVFASVLGILHDSDAGTDFNTTARIAVNAWSEMPRDPELREVMRNRYHGIRDHLLTLAVRWAAEGLVGCTPDMTAEIFLRTTLGLLAEEAIFGGIDTSGAGARLQHVLKMLPPSDRTPE
jgi:transcriptional regulator, tetR family